MSIFALAGRHWRAVLMHLSVIFHAYNLLSDKAANLGVAGLKRYLSTIRGDEKIDYCGSFSLYIHD